MLRWQVVAGLESFIANRTDKFRDAVLSSSLAEAVRLLLLLIIASRIWFSPAPVFLDRTKTAPGVAIAPETRKLARSIMDAVLRRHRRPSQGRLHPWVGQRQAELVWLGPGGAKPHMQGSG